MSRVEDGRRPRHRTAGAGDRKAADVNDRKAADVNDPRATGVAVSSFGHTGRVTIGGFTSAQSDPARSAQPAPTTARPDQPGQDEQPHDTMRPENS